MPGFSIDVTQYLPLIPLLKMKLHSPQNIGGKLVDVHAFIDKVTADGKLDAADIPLAAAIWFGSPQVPAAPPAPPVHVPPPQQHDDDVPDAPVGVGPLAKIELTTLRAVLNAKRFPKEAALQQLSYIPAAGSTINYGTAVTFEATLRDAEGDIIDTGKHDPNTTHRHTTAYICQAPDGSVAQIGPGSLSKGTKTIGAGGKNYEDTNGTNATFRFGFAEVPVEGEFVVWAEEAGIRSAPIRWRVS